nr:ribonuclease H-like domain-containing protein [Tanacetum cinerariifolium]
MKQRVEKEYAALASTTTKCTCHAVEGFKKHNQLMKLMQFLMGLDDSYMSIKSSILSRDPLPDVKSAYATIYSEESHRVVSSSMVGRTSNNNFRPNIANNAGPRHNKSNVNRKNRSSGLVCNECGYNGNISDRCFKIICYPDNFRKNKNGQNFNKKINSNNTIGLNTSSGCTDDQLSTLISLIKDNTLTRNNVQANMAGTYFNNSKDANHLNFFDLDYPGMPNDEESVDPSPNGDYRTNSYSGHSIVSGKTVDTDDIPDTGIDADISVHPHTTQDEKVITLEENMLSEGNVHVNPSSSSQDLDGIIYMKPPQGYYPANGIHIIRESGMSLKAYSDADWAKCTVTKKSVTGYCVFINNNMIFWKSIKQNTLLKSSTEVEYRALASVTSEGYAWFALFVILVEGVLLPSVER